jgi:Ca2+-binding EF-hand superfamily protein
LINTSKKLAGPFLINLRNKFQEIAGVDQLIDRKEFQESLEIQNVEISNRLFNIFDKDKSGSIDITEFMETIEDIISGSDKDKIKFAFNLHDLDDSGFIDKTELKIFIEQSFLKNSLDYDEFQLDLLVEEFFKRTDKDKSGTIDFGEFLDVAHSYPDFIEGFAVNPVSWLISDRYENQNDDKQVKKNTRYQSSIQVQDIGILQWLLIPRLIFLYNVLMNRKKNRSFVDLKAIHLLPSKILELTISAPDGFFFHTWRLCLYQLPTDFENGMVSI